MDANGSQKSFGAGKMPKSSTILIIGAIRAIPPGRVASYGMVAAMAGIPRGARQVVRVLHAMSSSEGLPWWRVVRKDGSIALSEGAGAELQASLLASEGVDFARPGVVDMKRFGME
jgi:methylated-DNA-protein-cysteine methyltransferase-like protein